MDNLVRLSASQPKKNNMKQLIVVTLFLFTAIAAPAQWVEKHNLLYKNVSYVLVTVVADSTVLSRLTMVENASRLSETDFFKTCGADPFIAITAGIVDSTCTPLGLCIKDRVINHPVNRDTGNGNFYIMPNGFISVDTAGTIHIQATEKYTGQELQLAIQSGPMLLIDGVINTAFDSRSQNRNIRCGAGLYTENNKTILVFIKSITPVTFYEIAALLKEKYNCRQALNLEGGDHCSLHLPTMSLTYGTRQAACRYLLVKP